MTPPTLTTTPTSSPDQNSSQLSDPIILKTDRLGRVFMPQARQQALLDRFETSSMSAQAFAAWAGVKYSTFQTWLSKRRSHRNPQSASTPQPRPIQWVQAVIESPNKSSMIEALEIELPASIRIRVTNSSQALLAAQLLRSFQNPC